MEGGLNKPHELAQYTHFDLFKVSSTMGVLSKVGFMFQNDDLLYIIWTA